MYSIEIKDQAAHARLMKELAAVTDNVSKEAGKVAWKTAKNTKSFIAKLLQKELGVTAAQKHIKKRIKEKRHGSYSSLSINESGGLPLSHYKGFRQTKQGVKYKPYANQTSTREGAFIIKKYGNSAWKRTGPQRLPIEKQFGPSPWAAFRQANGVQRTIEHARARLEYELKEAIRYLKLKQSGEI